MRKPKIYLETTVFNYYFDVERDGHAGTIQLFKEIKSGKYEAYTSSYVIDELARADDPKKSNMLALIAEYNINVLFDDEESRQLADIYIDEGIIPATKRLDSLHIAVTTANDLQYIFSFNFQHINRVKTKTMTSAINLREGYNPITIATPAEVIEYGKDE